MKEVVALRFEGETVVLQRIRGDPVEEHAELIEANSTNHAIRFRPTGEAKRRSR